jgi:predicted ferric reductase
MNDSLTQDVDFYYTVRHPEEALFLDEIQAAGERNPRFRPYICFSSTQGSLNMKYILKNTNGNLKDYHLYLCGPLPMIQAFEKKFREQGMPKDRIHYEEFNFR